MGSEEYIDLARRMAEGRGIKTPHVSIEDNRLTIKFDTAPSEKQSFEVSFNMKDISAQDTFKGLESALHVLTSSALMKLSA